MKNVLIPTNFQEDTIAAIKTAISQTKGAECNIVLMLLCDVPDTFSASYLLREMKPGLTHKESKILATCRELVAQHPNCTLKIKNQFGISKPVFKQLTNNLGVDLIILTEGYKGACKKTHKNFIDIALSQKFPILHIASNCEIESFNKALYLEKSSSRMNLDDLQEFLHTQFSLQIVGQTANFDETDIASLSPQLSELISKNGIDLIIETRKPESIKRNKGKNEQINELFGLPVLSVYEEVL